MTFGPHFIFGEKITHFLTHFYCEILPKIAKYRNNMQNSAILK